MVWKFVKEESGKCGKNVIVSEKKGACADENLMIGVFGVCDVCVC